MQSIRLPLLLCVLVSLTGCIRVADEKPIAATITLSPKPSAHVRALPGPQTDGSVLLPNSWSLRPAGKQIELADFPVNIAVHPGGRFAAVLHSGYSRHQLVVVDIQTAQVVSRTELNQAFYGLEFSADGKNLFCSGAGQEVVHSFAFENGQLSGHRQIRLRDIKQRGVPAGIALDKAGERLYAANVWGHRITR